MSNKALSELFRRWINRSRTRTSGSVVSRKTKLRVEEVEERLVPTTLPTAQVIDTSPVIGGYQPQAAIDPLNPNNIVLVSTNGTSIAAQASTNGGATWSTFFTNSVRLADPTIDFPPHAPGNTQTVRQYTNTSSPAVAFGRDGSIYITALEHNAAKTSGAVVVFAFDFNNGAITIRDLDPNDDYDTGRKSPFPGGSPGFSNAAAVVYRWINQEPAYNPTIAVDNNLPVYTDPETGETTATDTMVDPTTGASKAVYVAWNTDAVPGTGISPWNRNVILTAASSDLGYTFTAPMVVTNGGYVTSVPGQAGSVTPQILFTPGTINDNGINEPGRLVFAWSTTTGRVGTDVSQPDGGLVLQPASASSGHVRLNVNTGIPDATPSPPPPPNVTLPDTPGRVDIPLNVDLVFGGGGNLLSTDVLSDLDVNIAIAHQSLDQLRVTLTAPSGLWIDLLANRNDGRGNLNQPGGLPADAHLGMIQFGALTDPPVYSGVGTTFSDEASKVIFDSANVPTYAYPVRPSGLVTGGLPIYTPGGLAPLNPADHVTTLQSLYQGLTAADLSGQWILTVFDVRDNGTTPPPAFVRSVDFLASAYISNSRFGGDVDAFGGTLPGGADQIYPTKVPASPTLGIGPGTSFAFDTSVGSFSPFAGRLYAVYTGMSSLGSDPSFPVASPDIFLRYSDDNGVTWSTPTRVNDDTAIDNLSEGRRTQFMPTVAVDPTTGTVVVTWYDARSDAANVRVVTYIATSIDGGNTFSTHFDGSFIQSTSTYDTDAVGNQTWLNGTRRAIDAVTGQVIGLEPIPSNLPLAGPNGFGVRQALLAYGGEVHPFWSGNGSFDNDGQISNNNTGGNIVYTNTVHIAAGPRVVSSDMGPVLGGAGTATDGTARVNGFTIKFDRGINVASFTTADVQVFYRSVNTPLGIAATQIPLGTVIPIDLVGSGFPGVPGTATTFFVQFANPQSAVGTYSYQVGPDIRDRVRRRGPAQFTAGDVPQPITDFTTTTSSIVVNGIPGTVQKLRVSVDIEHTFDSDLILTLVAPNGQRVILSNHRGGSGANFTGTIFVDSAATAIAAGTAPFTGLFRPDEPLSNLSGVSINGGWQLEVTDSVGADIGRLLGWSITFLDAAGNPLIVTADGNQMDQDGDGTSGETVGAAAGSTDIYSVPASQNGIPFTLPYDPLTLPLIVPGPHVVGSAPPGQAPTSDNLVLNSGTGALDITFDRDIDPTTFRVGNVLRITGPMGPIEEQQDITVLGTTGTFTVTVNDGITSATTPALPFNIPASGGINPTESLENALAALASVGPGNVVVTSTATTGGTIYHVYFINRLGFHDLAPVTAAGSGGASTTVNKLYKVAPVGTANPATGGFRTFRITFPPQVVSGAYSVDIGTDKAGRYIQAVNQPRLIANLSAGASSVTVTFDSNTARVPAAADLLRVAGPNGAFNTGPITVIPLGGRTFMFQFSNVFPAPGQYVVEFSPDLLVKPGTNGNLNVAGKVDTNLNAGVNTLGMIGTAVGATQQKTYSTPIAANVAIPAQGIAELPLNITDDYLIQQILSATPSQVRDIRVTLNILFPNDPDLKGELVSPDGSIDPILLFDGPGAQGQANQNDFQNTILTDAAATPILTASPPFNAASGAFNPQLPLARLNGKGSKGTWILRITNRGTSIGTIQNWSLTLPSAVPGTGLGELNADKISLGFRIFTQDPSNPLTQEVWTPVGPASENFGGNSGRIGGLAVDPSDPSGNTVYLGGASGGVWKTTNFLTHDVDGPHWIPLTDFGKTFSLNIGSIAVFPRNNDTNQSIIIAATGEGDTQSRGVGFLISKDGGKTWNVYDSTNNVDIDGSVLPIDSIQRDHIFVGSTSFKVVVDPTLTPSGEVIIYAALSGTNGGIWRSNDTGRHWSLVRGGPATDVVLAAGSAPSLFDPSDPTLSRNLEIMYAAFRGSGVWYSPQATSALSMTQLLGGNGNPLFRDFYIQPSQPEIPINNPSSTPNGINITRISLAAPVQTNDPIRNVAYSGWLYALVDTGDQNGGLYMTKDFGRNWTKVRLPEYRVGTVASPFGYGSNDINNQDHQLFGGAQFQQGDYDQAIAIDPNNPNIVYLGGTNDGTRQPLGGFLRVDVTGLEDPQAMVAYNNQLPDGGTPQFTRANGSVIIKTSLPPPPLPQGPGIPYGVVLPHDVSMVNTGYLNLFRDPLDPFNSNATLYMTNIERFQNRGYGAVYGNFDAEVETDVHRIITFVDPLTGKTRLIVGDDQGVASVVDQGDRSLITGNGVHNFGIGFASQPGKIRNGDLQIVQFYYGAVQPSQLAADIAGALFYGMAQDDGFPVSPANILTTGRTQAWTGPLGDGTGVATDQTGSGTSYGFRWPCCGGDVTDFFKVDAPPNSANGGIGRTNGLLQSGDDPFAQQGQWPYVGGANFAVNPIDKNGIIISAPGNNNGVGRLFRTTNQGVNWFVIGETPTVAGPFASPGNSGPSLDGTYSAALAFGAPNPASPGLVNDFIYAGTSGGRVFVTRTGTAPWLNISAALGGGGALDGSAVQAIAANPRRGSTDLFVVTLRGVYYKADAFDTSAGWINITGNLFNLEKPVLPHAGNSADPGQTLQYLTAIAADWRYAIPVNPEDPQSKTFPVLYVGGEGGIFRSIDFGATWNYFPAGATYVDPDTGVSYDIPAGGYLPNAHVTDLDLSLGNIDPSSGLPVQGQQGLNLLLATTYGRGSFAIRLGDVVPEFNVQFQSGPHISQLINPNPIGGPSSVLDVQFNGSTVDPDTFTTSDVRLTRVDNGAVIPVTSVTSLGSNRFRITFAQVVGQTNVNIVIGYNPTGDGNYPPNTPVITDTGGHLMNQDGDGLNPDGSINPNIIIGAVRANGEPIIDQYRTTIQLNNPLTNNRLVVTSFPSTATAGVPVTVRIEARDTNDLIITDANGPLTLTPAPGTGAFTPSTVNLVNGVATFDVTYTKAGDQTINVNTNLIVSGQPINPTAWTTAVTASTATTFEIVPASSVVNSPATIGFTVTARDAFGNQAAYDGPLAITSVGAAANLPLATNMAGGLATFNGDFNTRGTVTITVSGPDLNNPNNPPLSADAIVSVDPGPATQIVVTAPTGPFVTGTPVTVTVAALDAVGNLANLNGPFVVSLSPSDPTATVTPVSPVFVNGQATFTVTFNTSGTYTVRVTTGTLTGSSGPITIQDTPPGPSPTELLTGIYGVGTGTDGSPVLQIFKPDGSILNASVPFPAGYNGEVDLASPGFTGGLRVSVADVTGDGVPDYVVGTGPTITASVQVIDGATGQTLLNLQPFEDFKGGVFVTTGDITGDGIAEIVITPDEGGGPRVTILRGGDFKQIANFFGIDDPNFRGGARAGVGDLNRDGFADVVVSAGFGGGPRISVFDGAALVQSRYVHPVGDFFLFESGLRNGAYVTVGDLDGDGFGDIIGGAGPGGGPRVLAISGRTMLTQGVSTALNNPVANFFGGDPENRGGIRLAAKNLDDDQYSDLITGSGEGGGSRVTTYRGSDLSVIYAFDALPGFAGGVFVG